MTALANILFVDDEHTKIHFIQKILEEFDIPARMEHVSSSHQALKWMTDNDIDLLIIDLQIPDRLGGELNPKGGKELLERLDMDPGFKLPTHILGLTQHDDSYNECREAFDERGWTLICGLEDRNRLASIIQAQVRHTLSPNESYDIAIITALAKTEFESVLKLPCDWIPLKNEDDCTVYYSGTIKTSNGNELSIIASSAISMGLSAASALTMKVCLKFKPSVIFMTGIAAGVKGKVNLGDILIANPSWDWGSGKLTVKDKKPHFLSSPRQESLLPATAAKLTQICIKRTYLDEIYSEWPADKRPPSPLSIHMGPVASGSLVLENELILDMIKSQHRETIGVEMEAYGVFLAASLSRVSPPEVIVIKSVCDFADPNKNDEWQTYAAHTSSKFVYKLIANDHLQFSYS
jgi:nucleoside phosphorylase